MRVQLPHPCLCSIRGSFRHPLCFLVVRSQLCSSPPYPLPPRNCGNLGASIRVRTGIRALATHTIKHARRISLRDLPERGAHHELSAARWGGLDSTCKTFMGIGKHLRLANTAWAFQGQSKESCAPRFPGQRLPFCLFVSAQTSCDSLGYEVSDGSTYRALTRVSICPTVDSCDLTLSY